MRVVTLLSLMLPILLLAPSSYAGDNISMSVDTPHVLIDSVMPAYAVEAIVLRNVGLGIFNMLNLNISDGEGTLRITANYLLLPGEIVVISSAESAFWKREIQLIYPSSEIEVKGRFTLADAGDEVSIIWQGSVLDVFVYGAGNSLIAGWAGDAYSKIGKGKMASRIGTTDSNSKGDWQTVSAGRSDYDVQPLQAGVEPFIFPDEGFSRIIRELSLVQNEVRISLYQLNNLSIASVLASLAREGCSVKILLEGSPVGGISEGVKGLLASLQDSGCDIRFIHSADGFKRYDYLHCKYAVIDNSRVIITSENWQDSSFLNNRGWGIAMENFRLASQMKILFDNDYMFNSPDIIGFEERFPGCLAIPLPSYVYHEEGVVPIIVETAEVRIIVCPDNAYSYLRNVIPHAEHRLYVQQFYTENSWLSSDSPLTWMQNAASQGADVRLLMDSSWFSTSKDNAEVVEALNVYPNFQAKLMDSDVDFNTLHNKGIIIDDSVLISSINWVNVSFFNNREVGVLINSSAIAAYFTRAFLNDWGSPPSPPQVKISILTDYLVAQSPILIEYSPSVGNRPIVNYSWDLNSDGQYDLYGPRQVLFLSEGNHKIQLMVTDDIGQTNFSVIEMAISTPQPSDSGLTDVVFLPILTIPLIYIVYRILKRDEK